MKTKLFVTMILALSAIIVSACTDLPGVQSNISSGVPWKFYVLGVHYSSNTFPGCADCQANTGWRYAIADLAVENVTNAPLWFPGGFYAGQVAQVANAELVDAGGFQRDGGSYGINWNSFAYDESHEHGFLLSPNFPRAIQFLQSNSKQPDSATLTLKFGGSSYSLDLQKPNANVKIPFDTAPGWKAKNVADSFEIAKDVRATLLGAKTVDAGTLRCCQYQTEYKGKTALDVTVRIENIGGFDLRFSSAISRLYAFDEQGHLAVGGLDTGDQTTFPPGSYANVDAIMPFGDFALGSVQPSWFVLCLSSNLANPANKQATPTPTCDIYQVNK